MARAVANGLVKNGLDHFNQFGQFERRNPSAIITRQPKVINQFVITPFN